MSADLLVSPCPYGCHRLTCTGTPGCTARILTEPDWRLPASKDRHNDTPDPAGDIVWMDAADTPHGGEL